MHISNALATHIFKPIDREFSKKVLNVKTSRTTNVIPFAKDSIDSKPKSFETYKKYRSISFIDNGKVFEH